MAKKGKEPAGLRRWRLAHRKKGRVRHMARKKRRGGRSRGSKAIPVLTAAYLAMPAIQAYRLTGLSTNLPKALVGAYTGYNIETKQWTNMMPALYWALGAVVLTKVGGKIANMTGLNRIAKKVSGGYVKAI